MANKNCLSYWFPQLVSAGIPVPRTEIVPFESDEPISDILDGIDVKGYKHFLHNLSEACKRMGFPVFLRTGHTSGKHHWKNNCYLKKLDQLQSHVIDLVEWSVCCDILGLPCDVWAVREMLPTSPIGICPLYGDMPVVQEFRCFIHNGNVECIHPYWPLTALQDGGFTFNPDVDVDEDWYKKFCQPMPGIRTLAKYVARLFANDGGWSVDIMPTEHSDLYVIDMAQTEKSYHWESCPNKVIQQKINTI